MFLIWVLPRPWFSEKVQFLSPCKVRLLLWVRALLKRFNVTMCLLTVFVFPRDAVAIRPIHHFWRSPACRGITSLGGPHIVQPCCEVSFCHARHMAGVPSVPFRCHCLAGLLLQYLGALRPFPGRQAGLMPKAVHARMGSLLGRCIGTRQ
jgi:hypothetical protein